MNGNFTRLLAFIIAWSGMKGLLLAENPTAIRLDMAHPRQVLQGMGCGAIYYEAHITSLGKGGRAEAQEKLYDAMFKEVATDFLNLYIRHDHEPENDNDDPYKQDFKDEAFAYCEHTVEICKAALTRRPDMQFCATLYTPPGWMKTNHDPSGGGEARATLLPKMELEMAEYMWAFLSHMQRQGVTVKYLSIANEPDWPHTQPGYCLNPKQHAELFLKCATYLEEMARRHPEVPRPKMVAPNVLSSVDCATNWLPPLLRTAGKYVDVIGSHDYDRRGDRWKTLVKAADKRPVWCTEWCVNGPDKSEGLINSAGAFWLAMSEAFNGGATAWFAYDWVYPPRQGGEALIHLDWGKEFTLTKIYHGYRQWCQPLKPGMRLIPTDLRGPAASGFSSPGLKVAAFADPDGKRLVLHLAAVQDAPVLFEVAVPKDFQGSPARAWRTSPTEDAAALPEAPPSASIRGTLPGRGLLTFEFIAKR